MRFVSRRWGFMFLFLQPRHTRPLRVSAPTRTESSRLRTLRHYAVSAPSSGSERCAPAGNLLEQLLQKTTIWADTADAGTVARLARVGIADVTTNPSIVSATALREAQSGGTLLAQADAESRASSVLERHERIAVELGLQLLDVVPGRVCTQLDIRCEDEEEMVAKARAVVATYADAGVAKERILIKTPATWAGIRATERLEREGIACLVTLVCSQVQGRAAAEAGASIIATYVGRVSDWHKAAKGVTTVSAPASEDPGVVLTNDLKGYFTAHGLATQVMAASFRNVDQVAALAGCDHLTIAPELIEKMAGLPPLDTVSAKGESGGPIQSARGGRLPALGDRAFIESLSQDVCGTDVLQSSIEGFTRDTVALENAIAASENPLECDRK